MKSTTFTYAGLDFSATFTAEYLDQEQEGAEGWAVEIHEIFDNNGNLIPENNADWCGFTDDDGNSIPYRDLLKQAEGAAHKQLTADV